MGGSKGGEIKNKRRNKKPSTHTPPPHHTTPPSTDIRYCYYADTHRVLGRTFGMLVLQDFEAVTPSLLARTVETVEGGGLVCLLLSSMTSLTQLYTLTMDVHARLRGSGVGGCAVVPRFNERLVLSLATSPACLIVDDELNVLPTSSHAAALTPIDVDGAGGGKDAAAAAELADLATSLAAPAGPLVSRCRTLDQAKAVVTFLDAASEKTLRSTVAATAARGRGKSAAVGLAVAGALALGYSNIFVTAPSPDNTRTLFEFIVVGLKELGYAIDFDVVEATDPSLSRAVVRINVFRSHRQTVQFVLPAHADRVAASAELVVIDEAAAIPLPTVKKLLGPYLVFLTSTVNGYEGTGRSLSLKLLAGLRAAGAKIGSGGGGVSTDGGLSTTTAAAPRSLRELTLDTPIRYTRGDPVEAWLNALLCLDATSALPPPPTRLPPPSACRVYSVSRDTLFSGHAAAEAFLQRAVGLLAASHYRNTPDDLLLLADAPAHRLFVLLAPPTAGGGDRADRPPSLPDVLAVAQVALEGGIARDAARAALAHGAAPSGDLIPWTVATQFQEATFAKLSGARVVRVAVHPDLPRAGYGSSLVDGLRAFYEGGLVGGLDESDEEGGGVATHKPRDRDDAPAPPTPARGGGGDTLHTERLTARTGLPPLLTDAADAAPPPLHWIGAAFGVTPSLFAFWSKTGHAPVYVRQTPSDVTGEHSVIVLRALTKGPGVRSPDAPAAGWLSPLVSDFRTRAASLLGGPLRSLPPQLALGLLDPRLAFTEAETEAGVAAGARVARADGTPLTPHDVFRLGAYASALVDHHAVTDLVPPLAAAWTAGRLPVSLSASQAALIVLIGLQRLSLDAAASALGLPPPQALALFNKAVRRLHAHLRACAAAAVGGDLPSAAVAAAAGAALAPAPGDLSIDAELDAAAAAAAARAAAALTAELEGEDMDKYAVEGDVGALGGSVPRAGALVSVPSDSRPKPKKKDKGGGADLDLYRKKGGGHKAGKKRKAAV